MSEAFYNIGGLPVRLLGDVSMPTAMGIPGMEVFRVAEERFVLDFRLDTAIEPPPRRLLTEFNYVDGCRLCRFGVDGDGVYYYEFVDEGYVRFDPRQPKVVELSTMLFMPVLRFALWTAYSIAALPFGSVPVHSSVVVCDGRSVMCLGESGTGKSTHTSLWINNIPHTHLLNDDSPIVRFDGDEVCVYGSPWGGKTPCFLSESHPVAAFLRLEQRPENTIQRLGVLDAFAALQPSCPPSLVREERCLNSLVEFVSNVIERVPVYRMGCLPNADAARLSYKTIMG